MGPRHEVDHGAGDMPRVGLRARVLGLLARFARR